MWASDLAICPQQLPGPSHFVVLLAACCWLQALQAMGPVLQQHMLVGPGGGSTLVQQQQQLPAAYPASKAAGPAVDDKQVRDVVCCHNGCFKGQGWQLRNNNNSRTRSLARLSLWGCSMF